MNAVERDGLFYDGPGRVPLPEYHQSEVDGPIVFVYQARIDQEDLFRPTTAYSRLGHTSSGVCSLNPNRK